MAEYRVGWDDERDIPVVLDEQADRPEQSCWRVVTHARNGGGWWTVAPERYSVRAEAEQAAARACRTEGGCSNAGVYPEVGGRVQVPGWIKVREEAGQGI